MSDPYQTLGLTPDSSDDAIRQRYLELVRKHSPERDPERFAAIRDAYEKLRDPVVRLGAKLFEVDSAESFDTILAEVKTRFREAKIPASVLLALAEQT